MTLLCLGLLILLIYLLCMVVLVQYKGDTSIANFTWGGGVLFVALFTFFTMSEYLPRQIIVTIFIALWAARLICHVYKRYTGKDPRFASWTWQGFKALIINFIWIFGQSIMIAIMSYPIILVNKNQAAELLLFDYLGSIVWIIGFFIESISDHQLFLFTSDPAHKGKVMRSGLWHYSRHPNYFGEVVMWWGIFLIALSVPYGWSAIITPATITFLLLFVTGVPLLEDAMRDNAEYQEYKRNTSMFIPWFSKK